MGKIFSALRRSFSFRPDLPFERDGSGRFLPWTVGMMVFLAALALAGALTLGSGIEEWDTGLSGRLTVQVPRGDGVADDGLQAVLDSLRETAGVAVAQVLSRDDTAKLLEPWLGAFAAEDTLPMPHLIDVKLVKDAVLDAVALAARLAEHAPGVAVDDHRVWLAEFIDLARTVQALAFLVVALVGMSAIFAVAFVTRSSLAVHRQVIELLHQMGARDAYVARQFQTHALLLAIRGSLAGGVVVVLVMMVIAYAGRDMEAALLPGVGLTPWRWVALAAVPVAATAIAMLTARVTVLQSLARMP